MISMDVRELDEKNRGRRTWPLSVRVSMLTDQARTRQEDQRVIERHTDHLIGGFETLEPA